MKKNKTLEFLKDYWILLLIGGFPIIFFVSMFFTSTPGTKAQVHWHMPLSYDLCGDTTQLKDSGEHGILHGHDDKQVHVEGVIDTQKRAETLGGFFDSAGIVFSQNQIAEYKNGDSCKGSDKSGKVSVVINGKENFEFRNYILNDEDEIKVLFK